MAAGDSGARKRRRLSRSGEFDRVYRDGTSQANRYLVLYRFPRPEDQGDGEVRLGISVGRKVGTAVVRNRVKRVLKEAFWSLAEPAAAGSDFVFVARPDIAELVETGDAEAVRECVRDVLAR